MPSKGKTDVRGWIEHAPETRPCHVCSGLGLLYNDRQMGAALKRLREDAGISLREVARRMGKSAPWLSHLERGKAQWNRDRVADFLSAINHKTKGEQP